MTWKRWGPAQAAGVFAASCGAFAAASIAFVARYYWRAPAWDHWSWLSAYYEKGFAEALVRQYNEHRLVIPGFFYLIDQEAFAGSNAFLLAALLLAQGGCAFLLIRPLWWRGVLPRPLALVVTGALGASMFWFLQAVNLFFPFQFHTVFCGLCLLAAAWVFSGLLAAGGRPGLRLAAAAGFGLLATFSFANGMLIWPVLLINGWAGRAERRTLWILGGCFLAALGFYLSGYQSPAHHAQPAESLGQPLAVLRYTLLFLALPAVGIEKADAGIPGNAGAYTIAAAGLAAALGLMAHHWRRRAKLGSAPEAFYVSVLMLTLGTAFLTALGRINFPPQAVLASRYATACLMFWGALAALAAIHVARLEASGGTGRAMLAGLLVLATASMLPSHIEQGRRTAEWGQQQELLALGLTAGVLDKPRAGEKLAPPGYFAKEVLEPMRQAGRGVFARPEASWVGAAVESRFEVMARPCVGIIDTQEPVAAAGEFPAGVRLTGWGWDKESGRVFERLIMAGERGEIVGLGTGRLPRPDVAKYFQNAGMGRSGWTGYARATGGPPAVFGLTRDGKACRIGVGEPLGAGGR